MSKWISSSSILALSLALSGCAGSPIADAVEGIFGVRKDADRYATSARPTTNDHLKSEPLHLEDLLDPHNLRQNCLTPNNQPYYDDGYYRFGYNYSMPPPRPNQSLRERDLARERECAFEAFYTYRDTFSPADRSVANETAQLSSQKLKDVVLVLNRNRVQDRLLEISDEFCTEFMNVLEDQTTKTDFALGSLAATLAGLGAIFTDPTTSRSLAGAAGIVGSINNERDESYFRDQSLPLVTKGIRLARAEVMDEINGRRYGPPFLESAGEAIYLDRNEDNDSGAANSYDAGYHNLLTCDATKKPEECTKIYNERIEQVKAQRRLEQLIKNRDFPDRIVRLASRPYIPLSPYDKVTIRLREEFKKEILTKRDELKVLQNKLERTQKKIDDLGGKEDTAKANRKVLEGERVDSDKRLLSLEERKKTADTAVDDAEKALNKMRSSLFGGLDSARGKQLTNALKNANEQRAGIEADLLKERLNNASLRQRLGLPEQPTTKQDTNGDKKEGDDKAEAGQQAEGSDQTIPQLVQANVESGELSKTDKEKLKNLKIEEEELEKQIKRLEADIADKDAIFDGEVAKIDAVVGHVPVTQYTVELAVSDARRYHDACSIRTGFDKAAESLTDSLKDPTTRDLSESIDSMTNLLTKIKTLREAEEALSDQRNDRRRKEAENSGGSDGDDE